MGLCANPFEENRLYAVYQAIKIAVSLAKNK